ncbi:DUF4249 domain-containing protein [Salinivirga cyanobacteriivorans]
MKQIIFLIIISTLFIFSCTERIELDSELGEDFPPHAVVEGMISTDTMAHVIKLSWSKPLYNDQEPEKITGANVKITGNNQEIILTEEAPGEYYTPENFHAVEGQRYYLFIDSVDTDNDGNFDPITASDSVPHVEPLDSIHLEWIDPWEAWAVKAYANEPGDEENFYMFKTFVNDTLVTDTLYEIFVTDDVFFNGEYINGLEAYFLNEEDTDERLYPNDTVTLKIYALTEPLYEFILRAQEEANYSAPLFSGPPSNVEHNLKGTNVFGFFMTASVKSAQAIWDTAAIRQSGYHY